MQMCQTHWDDLKEAIQKRGMWELVAPNGQAASYRMQQELSGTATNSTYDPLMAANWAIMGNALQIGGIYLLTGDYCPLCEVDKHVGPGSAANWISGCTDSILQYCKENHLIDVERNADGN